MVVNYRESLQYCTSPEVFHTVLCLNWHLHLVICSFATAIIVVTVTKQTWCQIPTKCSDPPPLLLQAQTPRLLLVGRQSKKDDVFISLCRLITWLLNSHYPSIFNLSTCVLHVSDILIGADQSATSLIAQTYQRKAEILGNCSVNYSGRLQWLCLDGGECVTFVSIYSAADTHSACFSF